MADTGYIYVNSVIGAGYYSNMYINIAKKKKKKPNDDILYMSGKQNYNNTRKKKEKKGFLNISKDTFNKYIRPYGCVDVTKIKTKSVIEKLLPYNGWQFIKID